MKITQQDYERLEKHIKKVMGNSPPIKEFKSPTAYRWQMFFKAQDKCMRDDVKEYEFLRDLYSYLNDDHLDTALRKITGTN